MLSRENTKKKVADNQMDYVDAESTEEFQPGQSQENPEVTSEKTTTSSVSSTDTDDEIVKRATFFVKTFVKEFEKKLFQYSEEVKPGSKIKKTGKILGQVDSTIKSAIPPGVRVIPDKAIEFIDYLSAKEHKKGAKSVFATVMPLEGNTRKILVDASLEIFQKFEGQFTEIMDISSFPWEMGIEKLAIDAVYRVKNYISSHAKGEKFSVDLVTRGVILGESKRKHLFTIRPGYQVKDKQSNEILMTSELYERVGIEKTEGDVINYYNFKKHDCVKQYGYRFPFEWELEKWEEVKQKYVLSETPEERYVSILDERKKEKLVSSILQEINGNDPVREKDIEKLHKGIKNLEILYEKKDKDTFAFNLGHLPKPSITREMMLDELKEELGSENQEVEMLRMVLINGEHGTGKSELARSCAHSEKNNWKKVAWIDATTYGTLSQSFCNLAKELGIPTKNNQELNNHHL